MTFQCDTHGILEGKECHLCESVKKGLKRGLCFTCHGRDDTEDRFVDMPCPKHKADGRLFNFLVHRDHPRENKQTFSDLLDDCFDVREKDRHDWS